MSIDLPRQAQDNNRADRTEDGFRCYRFKPGNKVRSNGGVVVRGTSANVLVEGRCENEEWFQLQCSDENSIYPDRLGTDARNLRDGRFGQHDRGVPCGCVREREHNEGWHRTRQQQGAQWYVTHSPAFVHGGSENVGFAKTDFRWQLSIHAMGMFERSGVPKNYNPYLPKEPQTRKTQAA